MNPGYTRVVYTPVLRSPLLFHQNTANFSSSYYPTQPTPVSSASLYYPYPYPSPYSLQPKYTAQTLLPNYPQAYPYYPISQVPTVPSSTPFSSYSVPNITYAPTASSKGLALILIATLVLVALDLVVVRPQRQISIRP